MQALLEGTGLNLILPAHLGLNLDVEESGSTYAENAALKALTYARASGLLTLADDSGLEVEALGGLPGLHSRRFTGEADADDARRRAYLLQQLSGIPRPWWARFHCTVAVATPQGDVYFADGECPGEIIPEERGHSGFGYDPIFLLTELGLTMAELSMEEKNRLSHRARAVANIRPVLTELITRLK